MSKRNCYILISVIGIIAFLFTPPAFGQFGPHFPLWQMADNHQKDCHERAAGDSAADPIEVSNGEFQYFKNVLEVQDPKTTLPVNIIYNSARWTYPGEWSRATHNFSEKLILRYYRPKRRLVNPYEGPMDGDGTAGGYTTDVEAASGGGGNPRGQQSLNPSRPDGGDQAAHSDDIDEELYFHPQYFRLFHYQNLRIDSYKIDPPIMVPDGHGGWYLSWEGDYGLSKWVNSDCSCDGTVTVRSAGQPDDWLLYNYYNPPEHFSIRYPDGTIKTYATQDQVTYCHGEVAQTKWQLRTYYLDSITNRLGDKIKLEYEQIDLPDATCLAPSQFKWRLTKVHGTLQEGSGEAATTLNTLSYHYDDDGVLFQITDDLGNRSVNLEVDERNNLIQIEEPLVTVNVNGAPPARSKTRFIYSEENPDLEGSGHNIVKVIGPNEMAEWEAECAGDPDCGDALPFVENIFDPSQEFRVVRQIWGSDAAHPSGVAAGGTYDFIMEPEPSVHPTYIDHSWFTESVRIFGIDPSGNSWLRLFDEQQKLRLEFKFTGRSSHNFDPTNPDDIPAIEDLCSITTGWPSASSSAIPTGQLITDTGVNPLYIPGSVVGSHDPDSSDPGVYIWRYDYDGKGRISMKMQIGEFGYDWKKEYIYDDYRLMIEKKISKDSSEEPIINAYSYEPLYDQIQNIYDPRGLSSNFLSQTGTTPDDYKIIVVYDYQEDSRDNIQAYADYWGLDLDQQNQSIILNGVLFPLPGGSFFQPISFDLGDQNGDPLNSQKFGNSIRVEAPVSTVPPGQILQENPIPVVETIATKVQYNEIGQVKRIIDGEGFETLFSYFDGIGQLDDDDNPENCGFLASVTREADSQFMDLAEVRFGYDSWGRQTVTRNARGFETTRLLDEEDRPVSLTREIDSGSGLNQVLQFVYDLNGNLTERWVTDQDPTFDVNYYPDGQASNPRLIKSFFTYNILDQMIQKDVQISLRVFATTKIRFSKSHELALILPPEFNEGNDTAKVEAQVYDELGRLHSVTSRGLPEGFLGSPANGNITERFDVDAGLVPSTTTNFYSYNRRTEVRDAMNVSVEYGYDNYNRLISLTDPLGNSVNGDRDPAGNITVLRNFEDATLLAQSEFDYDELNRLHEMRRAWIDSAQLFVPSHLGQLTPFDEFATFRLRNDRRGRAVEIVDDNRNSISYGYDGLGRLTSLEIGEVFLSNFDYDPNGNLIKKVNIEQASDHSRTYTTWYFHDGLDRLTAKVQDAGNTGYASRFLYDTVGNLAFQSNAKSEMTAGSNPVLSSLDSSSQHEGLPGLEINNHGNLTWFFHDDRGLQSGSVRPLFTGGQPGIIPTLMAGEAGDGIVETIRGFDLNGRLTFQADDKNHTTILYHNSFANRITKILEDGTALVTSFNPNGLVRETEDDRGVMVSFNYDGANRLISKDVSAPPVVLGTRQEKFEYDGMDRVTRAYNLDAIDGTILTDVTRSYDSLSRITREGLIIDGSPIQNTWSIYDGIGNMILCEYPGERVLEITPYFYRIDTIQDQDTLDNLAEFEYYGPNRVLTRNMGNNTQFRVDYDILGRKDETWHNLDVSGSLTNLDHRRYGWDRAHNKKSRLDSNTMELQSFTYDSLNRLRESDLSAPGISQQLINYALDGVQNRISVTGGSHPGDYFMDPTPVNPADDQMNQYTETPTPFGSDIRQYDGNGNLTEIAEGPSSVSLSYNFQNQMVRYQDTDTHEYLYDALGRRVRKIVNAGPQEKETRFFYMPGFRVCEEQEDPELDGSFATVATYVYGNEIDEVLSMRRNLGGVNVDFFYHEDDLGNIVKLSDESGGIVEQYEYEDFGKVTISDSSGLEIQESQFGNPYLFTGRRLDEETGLYFFRFRYLDSDSGKFTSRDPLGSWTDLANLGNGLTYAANNPSTLTDPFGLIGGWGIGAGLGKIKSDSGGNEGQSGDEPAGGGKNPEEDDPCECPTPKAKSKGQEGASGSSESESQESEGSDGGKPKSAPPNRHKHARLENVCNWLGAFGVSAWNGLIPGDWLKPGDWLADKVYDDSTKKQVQKQLDKEGLLSPKNLGAIAGGAVGAKGIGAAVGKAGKAGKAIKEAFKPLDGHGGPLGAKDLKNMTSGPFTGGGNLVKSP